MAQVAFMSENEKFFFFHKVNEKFLSLRGESVKYELLANRKLVTLIAFYRVTF